jgi:hypothetical protein
MKLPIPCVEDVFGWMVDSWYDVSNYPSYLRILFWVFLPITGILYLIAMLTAFAISTIVTVIYGILWFWVTGIYNATKKKEGEQYGRD